MLTPWPCILVSFSSIYHFIISDIKQHAALEHLMIEDAFHEQAVSAQLHVHSVIQCTKICAGYVMCFNYKHFSSWELYLAFTVVISEIWGALPPLSMALLKIKRMGPF